MVVSLVDDANIKDVKDWYFGSSYSGATVASFAVVLGFDRVCSLSSSLHERDLDEISQSSPGIKSAPYTR